MKDKEQMILAIDTSSPIVGVAVSSGATLLASTAEGGRRSSRELLRMIARTLAAAESTLHSIDGLVALRGPGSFTGLRIGLATIYGLHQASGIPARGISTLEVLASAVESDQKVLAVVDALRGEWFVQSFSGGPSRTALGSAQCLTTKSIAEMSPGVVVGHGVGDFLGPFLNEATKLVDPGSLAPFALRWWRDRQIRWNSQTLTEPLYFRQPAAVESRDSSIGSKT